jgi:hypothetical protein
MPHGVPAIERAMPAFREAIVEKHDSSRANERADVEILDNADRSESNNPKETAVLEGKELPNLVVSNTFKAPLTTDPSATGNQLPKKVAALTVTASLV